MIGFHFSPWKRRVSCKPIKNYPGSNCFSDRCATANVSNTNGNRAADFRYQVMNSIAALLAEHSILALSDLQTRKSSSGDRCRWKKTTDYTKFINLSIFQSSFYFSSLLIQAQIASALKEIKWQSVAFKVYSAMTNIMKRKCIQSR